MLELLPAFELELGRSGPARCGGRGGVATRSRLQKKGLSRTCRKVKLSCQTRNPCVLCPRADSRGLFDENRPHAGFSIWPNRLTSASVAAWLGSGCHVGGIASVTLCKVDGGGEAGRGG